MEAGETGLEKGKRFCQNVEMDFQECFVSSEQGK